MADRKISQLDGLSPVKDTDYVPLVDADTGQTKRAYVGDFRQASNSVSEEVPLDSGDHINFTIAHAPLAGSFRLFRGGSRQQSVGDYTQTGVNVALVVPLSEGEVLLADYSF